MWGSLWAKSDTYTEHNWNDLAQLPALMVDAIRTAAASFPSAQAPGRDNMAPRAMLRLSGSALQALAILLHKLENAGEWADDLDLFLVVLPSLTAGSGPLASFHVCFVFGCARGHVMLEFG